MAFGIFWPEPDDALELLDRLLQLAGVGQNNSLLKFDVGIVGMERRDLGEQGLSLVFTAQFLPRDGEVVLGGSKVGPQAASGAIILGGLADGSGKELAIAGDVKGVGILGVEFQGLEGMRQGLVSSAFVQEVTSQVLMRGSVIGIDLQSGLDFGEAQVGMTLLD